jgi:hypothetical protein
MIINGYSIIFVDVSRIGIDFPVINRGWLLYNRTIIYGEFSVAAFDYGRVT